MGRSAGWGAACDPCAKAKTRCMRSRGKDCIQCDRCQSLNLTCSKQVRKPRKKRLCQDTSNVPSFSVAQLGQKHKDANNTADGSRPSTTAISTGDAHTRASGETRNPIGEPINNVANAQQKPNKGTGPFSAAPTLPGFHPFPNPTCTCLSESDWTNSTEPMESDEVLLSVYRTRLSPQYPFVIIPDGKTLPEIESSRPILAKVIRMVASLRHRTSMWKQRDALMRRISDAVFLGSDRSLDLLQGIIVFLGFYHYFCIAHGQFNSLQHQASSMIADMKLDRPFTRSRLRRKQPRGIDPEEPETMSNDERRVILAVWYINSSSAAAFNKVNSPSRNFTKHMAQCLQSLQDRPEFETDRSLVQLIRAQRMNDMIAQLHQSNQAVDTQLSMNGWTDRLDALLTDLEGVHGRNSRHKDNRYLVHSHHNFALLQLLEPQLVELNNEEVHEAVVALRNTPEFFHVASRSYNDAAVTALRAWYERWLTMPVCHFFYMPMPGILQLMNATTILLRRSRLMLLARHRLGDSYTTEQYTQPCASCAPPEASACSNDMMLDLLEHLSARFEEARVEMTAAHGSEWTNDLLDLVGWKLRERKACFEKWVRIIATETHSNFQPSFEVGKSQTLGGFLGMDGEWTASQNLEGVDLWEDPLEAFLLGGDAYQTWLWTSAPLS